MQTRHSVVINLAASEVRNITFQGAPHLVVPAVLLATGVHNGSAGPLLYEASEIRASVPFWNGKPVTLGHPMSGNSPVSAVSSPDVFERSLGTVFNTRMEGDKLKANLYLHAQRTEQIAPLLMQALKSGRQIDVSTGLFSQDQPVSGTWNTENYVAVVRNIKPDHLAVLLDQPGACSWADGCGLRANSNNPIPTVNINDFLYYCGKKGEMTMNNVEVLELPVLNWNEEKQEKSCPCKKDTTTNITDNHVQVLELPKL